MPITVTARNRLAVIRTTSLSMDFLKIMRSFPSTGKFYWEGKNFVFEPTAQAVDYIKEKLPNANWDEGAKKFAKVIENIRANVIEVEPQQIRDFIYKTVPYKHQSYAFMKSRDREYYALLMEQGTGKTKVILDTAAYLYAQGKIRGLLVIAKNGVHRNWVDNEVPAHLPDWVPRSMAAWNRNKGEKGVAHVLEFSEKSRLAILTINVEALSTKRGEKICERFLLAYPSMVVVDESTSIKTPGAKRTKSVHRLGAYGRYRRILTGTPITNGPLDAYSQFSFLSEDILGHSSYYSFKAHYAVQKDLPGKTYRGRPIQIVVGYRNLPELQQKIEPHSYRVLKSDCLDLPPKLYTMRYFEMSDDQERIYEDLCEEIVAEFRGHRISAPLAITRMLRLHQICCGFVPTEKQGVYVDIEESNPRINLLLDVLSECQGKAIIYANYTHSLRAIWKALGEEYGLESMVAYSGQVKDQDKRAEAVRKFQDPNSKVRWFVAQTEAAAYGLTLTAANTVVYYSNDYKLETRLQSEDRPHRIGQHNPVLYVDLAAQSTVDVDIITALRSKFDIASQITGDKLVNWLVPS